MNDVSLRSVGHFSLLLALALCSGAAAAAPDGGPSNFGVDPEVVTLAERNAEVARLKSQGVILPPEGMVLERPFAEPFSRRSFIVPLSWFRKVDAGEQVSPDALAQDLGLLKAAMSRAYGGWESARARGWDWDGWFNDWEAMLKARQGQSLGLAEAFLPMKKLMAFQLDNHTTLPLSRSLRFGSGSATAVLVALPEGFCTQMKTADGRTHPLDLKDPGQRVRRAQTWDGAALAPAAYLSYPAQRGELKEVLCGSRWIPAVGAGSARDLAARRVLALSGQKEDGPVLKRLAPDVAYLRLPSFTKGNRLLLEARQSTWPRPSGKEAVLIVDLRGNEGGDVAPEALEGWVDLERMRPAFQSTRHDGASCLYEALRWGYVMVSGGGVKKLPAELSRSLEASVADFRKPAPPGCPRAVKDQKGAWDLRQHTVAPPGWVAGHRRVIVLVDEGVGSDGEMMTELLASLPETVLVGVNTYGVAQYVQPGYGVLPHTRLPFRFALGTSDIYGDNRSVDGYGLDVDVVLGTERAWSSESLLRLARHFAGPVQTRP